jgi:hypothetical protein
VDGATMLWRSCQAQISLVRMVLLRSVGLASVPGVAGGWVGGVWL